MKNISHYWNIIYHSLALPYWPSWKQVIPCLSFHWMNNQSFHIHVHLHLPLIKYGYFHECRIRQVIAEATCYFPIKTPRYHWNSIKFSHLRKTWKIWGEEEILNNFHCFHLISYFSQVTFNKRKDWCLLNRNLQYLFTQLIPKCFAFHFKFLVFPSL